MTENHVKDNIPPPPFWPDKPEQKLKRGHYEARKQAAKACIAKRKRKR